MALPCKNGKVNQNGNLAAWELLEVDEQGVLCTHIIHATYFLISSSFPFGSKFGAFWATEADFRTPRINERSDEVASLQSRLSSPRDESLEVSELKTENLMKISRIAICW